jgi:ferric-dicitrate binding protein FerR (iron transport regulator)
MDRELLFRFFEGKTSSDEEILVRTWVESSSENMRVFFKERKFFDIITLLSDEKVPVRRLTWRVKLLKNFARIAVVAAFVLGGNFLYNHIRQAGNSEPLAVQIIRAPAGQRVNIVLPDGSNVWLNANSELKYPVSFNLRERVVELDGEACFEVSKNVAKPFSVKTSKGVVEVTGTKFNLEAYSCRKVFETTLMEGEVKIRLNDAKPEDTLTLTPDKKAVFKDGKLSVEEVSDYSPYRWTDGLLCFKNASFLSIMDNFEKYYGVSFKVKNQKLLKSYYTGKFRLTDGIDYALRVLQKDMAFKHRWDEGHQIIHIE